MGKPVVIDNPAAKFQELFEKAEHLPDSNGLSRAESFARLNELGVEGFLELVAKGRLVMDVAIMLEIPVTHVKQWVDQNIPAARLEETLKLAAEAFVIKSLLPLTVSFDSPGHASIAKALSDRMAWVAAKLDPGRWGEGAGKKPSAVPVQLVFNGVSGLDSMTVTVNNQPEQVKEEKPENVLNLLRSEDYVVADE